MFNTIGQSSPNFADEVEKWPPTKVAAWLQGLDEPVLPYLHLVINRKIGGSELFTLDEGDLERIGIANARARQIIMFAIFQLSDLCYSLDRKNLQTLAMQLGVQARNLHNDLQSRLNRHSYESNASLGWLPNDVLSYVSSLIDITKEIIGWLDRSPFDTLSQYVTTRKTIHSFATTIVQSARQPSCKLRETAVAIQMACTQLDSISTKIIQEFNDPLILQTAHLERVIVRRPDPFEDFGIDIESTTEGVHIVAEVKFQTPADFCGKIEAGDEIVQVCGQTVISWPLPNLAALLKDTRTVETEIVLKKRPRNRYGGYQTLTGKTTAPSTPKVAKANNTNINNNPHKASVPAPIQQALPLFAKPRRRSSSMSVPRTPVEKIRSEIKTSPPGSPVSPIPYILLPPNEQMSQDDENRFVVGMGMRQRRATVSGGSPTLKRLSLHLNRHISVSPRSQTQWFQDNASAATSRDRKSDLGDLDMGRVRLRLSRPQTNFRASLIDNRLYISTQDFPDYSRKKRKNSSVGSGFGVGGDRFDEAPNAVVQQQSAMDDDVFDDERAILDDLAERALEAMPSDSSEGGELVDDEKLGMDESSDGSILEEAASNDVPPEARINQEEWDVPEMDDGLSIGTPDMHNNISMSGGLGGNVHKTWSYPGHDSTAPRLVQNPLATLPRTSQEKLKRFFGESSIGSSTWYDSEELDDNSYGSIPRPPRKSPMSSSQASVASSNTWSAKLNPRRPKMDNLRNWISSGTVGQVLHTPRRHRGGEVLPSSSGGEIGSPILTGMHRLASTRQGHGRSVDASPADDRKSMSTMAPSLVNQQLLARLTNGGSPDMARLKLSCYLPCTSIGTAEHAGWLHRARCSFENQSSKKWKKRWVVLKRGYLFLYRYPDDTKAEGIIWLPSFKVCPTGPEYKTKKKKWLQSLGLAAIGYESQSPSSSAAAAAESGAGAEYYFYGFDETDSSKPHQRQSGSKSDLFLNPLRQSWRRSQLSRDGSNSNESSLSCHSERAISTSSSTGAAASNTSTANKVIRDPLHVRGGDGARSRSAGRLEDESI